MILYIAGGIVVGWLLIKALQLGVGFFLGMGALLWDEMAAERAKAQAGEAELMENPEYREAKEKGKRLWYTLIALVGIILLGLGLFV